MGFLCLTCSDAMQNFVQGLDLVCLGSVGLRLSVLRFQTRGLGARGERQKLDFNLRP